MARRGWSHFRLLRWLLGLAACGVGPLGCSPSTRVTVFQPAIEGRQRKLELASERARWAPAQHDARLLVEFPLPGAATGEPMYLLYLRWPGGATGLLALDGAGAGPRGFLIQTRGRYAGLASIVSGSIEVSGTSQARDATRELRLDLVCEDGTRLAGRVRAGRDDHYVRYFETDRRPADVQTLSSRPDGG